MTQRLLVLSPTPTWPLDFGNRRRIYETCSWFKRNGYRVTFLHYASEHDWRTTIPPDSMENMQAQWDQVHHIPPQRPLHCAPAGSHHQVDEWWDPAIEAHLRWLFSVQQFDIFLVNYTWLSRALTLAPEHTFRILDTHDKFSGRKEMLLKEGLEPEFFYMTEDGEREALARANLVWAIKKDEQEQFSRMTSLAVRHATVPHAMHQPVEVDIGDIRERIDQIPHRSLRVGCLGGRNTINAVNFRRFIDAIGQVITRDLASVEVVIAGSVCDLLEDVRKPYVHFMGYLDDVSEFYDYCDVVVCPLMFSTGLKIKVAEALGLGKPIICHRHSFEGFTPFHPMQTMDSLEAIAEACVAMSFQPSILYDLTAAAVRSAKVTQEEFRRSLLASVTMARNATVSLVMTLPDLQDVEPRIVEHINDLLNYLRWAARVSVHYDGRCNRKVLARLKAWSSFATVCIAPGVRDAWAEHGNTADLGGLTVQDLSGMVETSGAKILWIAGGRTTALRDVLTRNPGLIAFGDAGSFRQDPLRAQEPDEATTGPLPVAFAVLPFSWVSQAEAPCFDAGRNISVPFFYRYPRSLNRPRRGGDARRLVMAANQWHMPLAKALAQVLTTARAGLDVLIVTNVDDHAVQPGISLATSPTISKVAVVDRKALTLEELTKVDVVGCVFLGEESQAAFDVLEVLVREGCPVITTHSGYTSRRVMALPPLRHQANSLLQLVNACQDLFGEDDEARANTSQRVISPEMFDKDAGWAFVWRQIKAVGALGG